MPAGNCCAARSTTSIRSRRSFWAASNAPGCALAVIRTGCLGVTARPAASSRSPRAEGAALGAPALRSGLGLADPAWISASRPGPRGDWLGDAFYHALTDRLSSSCLDGFLATCQSSQPRHVTDDHHVSVKERDVLASEPSKNAIDRFPGQPEMITDLLLRKVQVKCRPRDQSAPAQSVVEVNQHRGNSFRCFEAGDPSRKVFGTPSGLNKKRGEACGNLAVFHQPIK